MTKKLILEYPIVIDGEEVKELPLQRLKVKALRTLPESLFEEGSDPSPQDIVPLISAVTGLTEDQADDIDLADLMNFSKEMGSFLEESLQTGKK